MGVIGKTGLSTDKVIIKKPVFFKGKFDFYLIRAKKWRVYKEGLYLWVPDYKDKNQWKQGSIIFNGYLIPEISSQCKQGRVIFDDYLMIR